MAVPTWVILLEAANGDPLRAQEIEENLTAYWWSRYQEYTKERSKVKK